ncbi:MAG TPA: hypothetical protein VHH88_13525 [Verrucomicrobiae bacterium]|nr:hypothetical protein [Verrucomicrobiae bacterium]
MKGRFVASGLLAGAAAVYCANRAVPRSKSSDAASRKFAELVAAERASVSHRPAFRWGGPVRLRQFGFGMLAGAIFSVALHRLKRKNAVLHGMLFSLGLGYLNWEGWAPKLVAEAPSKHEHARADGAALIPHVVYGTVLGAAVRGLDHVSSG